MALFLLRLQPPRPTFAQDMTGDERQLMGEHIGYWSGLMGAGRVLVFGPVAEPAGNWGVGIVEAEGEDDVRSMIAGDPVIRRGEGFRYDFFAMPGAIAR
jgi:uncharacterized protein